MVKPNTTETDASLSPEGEVLLPDHCIISATGEAGVKLLQGQCTGDFNQLASGKSVLAAHCTPKGRMLSSFVAARISDDVIGLRVHKSIAEQAVAALAKYAVFFKVKLAVNDMAITCQQVANGEADAGTFAKSDAGISLYHSQGLIETWHTGAPSMAVANANFWEYQQITRGLAEVTAATYEQHLPQAFNYDLVDGINFKKGCYTGQEIIARVHYKGQSKQRLHCLVSNEPATIDQTVVDSNGKARGDVVRVANWQGQFWLLATTNAYDGDETLMLENSQQPLTREALPYAIP